MRERFADEMPAVVIVVDRRPEMALYPPDLPWLHKHAALHAVARVLVASALNQRSLVAYLDYAAHRAAEAGEPFWEPPRAQASVWRAGLRGAARAATSTDDVRRARGQRRRGHSSSFAPCGAPCRSAASSSSSRTSSRRLRRSVGARGRCGWDVVPVIVQDPTWEQSFPHIDGVLVALADAHGDDRAARSPVGERGRGTAQAQRGRVSRRCGATSSGSASIRSSSARPSPNACTPHSSGGRSPGSRPAGERVDRPRTRGELAAVAIAVLAALVLLILTVFAHRWWTGEGGSYAPPRAIVSANVTPARSLFGEVLTARARIVVDPARVDAQTDPARDDVQAVRRAPRVAPHLRRPRACRRRRFRVRAAVHLPRMPAERRRPPSRGRGRAVARSDGDAPSTWRRQRRDARSSGRPSRCNPA